jgi:hypothetical protein
MIKRLLLSIFCMLVKAYNLIPNYTGHHPRNLSVCPEIHPKINQVALEMTQRHPRLLQLGGDDGEICSADNTHYGLMLLDKTGKTDILIANRLAYRPNTLRNVFLHEMGHSLGLEHSDKDGIMNYSIWQDTHGNIVEDQRRLYLSGDDIRGIRKVSKRIHNF